MGIQQAIALTKQTYSKWSEHEAPRLGASVAFYSLLSFAPLLLLATAVIALVFDESRAQGALIDEAKQLIGDRGAETVESLLKNAQKPSSGIVASVIAFVTLLFGASGVFTELQSALNLMWEAKPKASNGLLGLLKQRIFSFGMVLSVGFLLLVSLVLSAGLAYAGHAFGQVLPVPEFVLHVINFAISFGVVAALFALMFKYMPDVKVPWKDVTIGALGTALLFTAGKFLLGLYLGKASVGSTYGAAGSLVAVIVWIYYSAQIFFFGAEFTHVYAERTKGNAEPVASAPAQSTSSEQRQEVIASTPEALEKHSEPVSLPPAEIVVAREAFPSLRATPRRKPETGLLTLLAISFILGRFSKASKPISEP